MDNELIQVFRRLRQDSKDSVNSGKSLSDFTRYMHVERPTETYLKDLMTEINTQNGGIVFLVGSAGDGKSHMLSSLKSYIDSTGFVAYNDATESNSPKMSAIEILKRALCNFNDANIAHTTQRLLLAINLGKLSAFVEDDEVQRDFSTIVKATQYLVGGDRFARPNDDCVRIKIMDLSTQNLFEFKADQADNKYPVDSIFMKVVLDKVTAKKDENPFYVAFQHSCNPNDNKLNPVVENYRLLSIPAIQDSIVKLIIEAIIRFRLIVTPRDFLDFVYSIVVPDWIDRYVGEKLLYDSLLPSLLYENNGHKIQQVLSMLDPLRNSNRHHDKELSMLFTSYDIPENYFSELPIHIESKLISTIRKRYSNHGENTQNSAKLVFRLKHLLEYHSDSAIYRRYLHLLCRIFNEDVTWKKLILDPIEQNMPRHYGSYIAKRHYVPLQNLQGSKFLLFSKADIHRGKPDFIYQKNKPNSFCLEVALNWVVDNTTVRLILDYKLFEHLDNLSSGKLSINYEGEQNIAFTSFIQEIVRSSECEHRIIVVGVGKKAHQEWELTREEEGELNLLEL